jgi:hypothetical protein
MVRAGIACGLLLVVTACDLAVSDEKQVSPRASQAAMRCTHRLYDSNWVCRVAETAGYRVVGDTGSALIARGRGAEFYIWTTRVTRPVAQLRAIEGWSRVARVKGVPIFGDRALWRFWVARGRIVWLQAGPRGSSKLPSLPRLVPLVEASRRVAPG